MYHMMQYPDWNPSLSICSCNPTLASFRLWTCSIVAGPITNLYSLVHVQKLLLEAMHEPIVKESNYLVPTYIHN